MNKPLSLFGSLAAIVSFSSCAGPTKRDVEALVASHMVGEAMLAAHYVAEAERSGKTPEQINAVLAEVADASGIDEFWITDSSGRVYLTNTGVAFAFSPDPEKEPQASAFWPLLEGEEEVVVQEAQVREIDDRVFKYVRVSGVDKPRIVQVGVSTEHLEPGR